MIAIDKQAAKHKIPLTGHCTDSASNALKGLTLLSTPSCFNGYSIKFIGLPIFEYHFFSPLLRPPYPSIAYPCWDHSCRTSVRNLMNTNIMIVCGVLPNKSDGIQHYKIASIQDLHTLKSRCPTAGIKHTDITPLVKQNCDATTRALTDKTISDFATYVPESKGTQLYLKTSVWVHAPFRNSKFGSPPVVVRSLCAGLMTFRRLRCFVQLVNGLTLAQNLSATATI